MSEAWRICRECGRRLPHDRFGVGRRRCRDCVNARQRQRYRERVGGVDKRDRFGVPPGGAGGCKPAQPFLTAAELFGDHAPTFDAARSERNGEPQR